MNANTQIEPDEPVQQSAFACPHCNLPVMAVFPQRFDAGEKVRCPFCFGVFVIPEQDVK